MAESKTKSTDTDVQAFVAAIENKRRREDSLVLLDLMGRAAGFDPRVWGDSMVGYGQYRYKYKSGRSGEYFLTGFSPRKSAMSIYVMPGFKQYEKQLALLGKHKHSVSCLYVTRLANIDLGVLENIVADSVSRMKKLYPDWSA